MKKLFTSILAITLIITLCSLLFGCEKTYDDKVYDFYLNNCGGQFNVIELDFGYDNKAVYYLNEHYGVWSNINGNYLFNFDYVPRTQRGGQLMINIITEQSYYQSVVQQGNGKDSLYYGKLVFRGTCAFSDNKTIATISPDNIYLNEMFINPEHTIVMTKTSIPAENIVPFDVALSNMNFVSNDYFEFISNSNSSKFLCDMANFWVECSTMTGEWNTNGSTIPIRMKLHDNVPYVEIYDISGSSEKLILKSFANVIDGSRIELVEPEGELFYSTPSSVIISKTN